MMIQALLIFLSLNLSSEITLWVDGIKVNVPNTLSFQSAFTICGKVLEIDASSSISSIYLMYNLVQRGILSTGKTEIPIGRHLFLHEFIALNECAYRIRLSYEHPVEIINISCFSSTVPDWVERWKPPHTKCDLLLLPTHSDDEHLFFAGLLPTMVNEYKAIQVVYTVNHQKEFYRNHELLSGLWEVGIRHYPVFGIVPDQYASNLTDALNHLSSSGLELKDVIAFHRQALRRFQPLIVISHDERGETGHGQHILTTYSLKQALQPLINNSSFPYKVYLHSGSNYTITMNYDIALDYFHGYTAYQVSKQGFAHHISQRHLHFTKWLEGVNNSFTTATQIITNSPLVFGLYYSRVGYTNSSDLYENIPTEGPRDIPERIVSYKTPVKCNTQMKKKRKPSGSVITIIIFVRTILLFLERKGQSELPKGLKLCTVLCSEILTLFYIIL